MQSSYLFLVLAVAAVNSEIIDINSGIDKGLAQTNEFLRKHQFTSVRLPKGSYGSHVSFSDSDVLGLDSLKRTDNCTLEVVEKNITLDLHYGFGLYQQSFKILSIFDQEMSASFRIRDNSVRLYYTVHFSGDDGLTCSVTLHDLSFERLAKVDFSSSRSEFDGADVEEIFEKEVVPFLNNKIDKAAVEKALQQQICKQQHQEVSEQMPMIHMSILQQIGVSAQ
ncbi:uncharacterized protein [Halyomorpha halys]|uniref:uncharacterized protein isoform X2 n=1 Tax=Halyomorpha halys TaxID=286706 RepID=UPI0006D52814|nr:uncharacterized protein LOC106682812 isoform X2 [Halyomorpha halys]